MPYIPKTNTHMNNEKKGKRRPARFYGADKAGPVKIIKADGSVEVQPAMTAQELSAFLDNYE